MNTIQQTYKQDISERFAYAMRIIIAERKNGCKNASQFSEMIGEHAQNISKINNGQRSPTLEQVARICNTFNLSPAWLILGKGNIYNQ